MTLSLETEFEVTKVISIASERGFVLVQDRSCTLPTFRIWDEYLTGIGVCVGTLQWTEESWAVTIMNETSWSGIELVLIAAKSRYFREI